MRKHYTPRPPKTDDICTVHNRRLRDYEVLNGGCQQCALERKREQSADPGRKTVINVLPPEKHRVSFDEFNDNIMGMFNTGSNTPENPLPCQ